MGDSHMGLHARLMSQALRKLTAVISKSNTSIIFINQIRMKIGVMFGNPETTTGGNALKFYSSVRIDLRRIESIKKGDEVIGNRVRAKIVKNKVAAPFRDAEFEIYFNEGISQSSDLVDLGVKFNVLDKSGSWFTFEGERVGQGRDNAKKYFEDNAKAAQKLEKLIIEKAKAKENPAKENPAKDVPAKPEPKKLAE